MLKQVAKTSYDNVNAEDLAQRIVNTGEKCRLFGVNSTVISSILMRKNVSINLIIRKVTRRFPVFVQQIVFISYVMS